MKRFQAARSFLEGHIRSHPQVGVVLGSGLGGFAGELANRVELDYTRIPGWPPSTAVGHAGQLVFGELGGTQVAVMSGRAHLYEGYSTAEVTFGVRLLGLLGVRLLILTNAAGAINLAFRRGGLVLISDHINLQGVNPLTGANDESLGPRFPDMSQAYPLDLRETARAVGSGMGIELMEGVYAALPGPSYETPAEIRYLRIIGADLVGMSTVPEVIAANHMGIRCLAISCVTNMAAGIEAEPIQHEEVLETGAEVRETLIELLKRLIPRLPETAPA